MKLLCHVLLLAISLTAIAAIPQAASGDPPVADYVIITTSLIADPEWGSQKLQDFVDHKTQMGFTVRVVTEEEWGGGYAQEAAENLRSWLQQHYQSWGIHYVLLIGDPAPYWGDVPTKETYPLWPDQGAMYPVDAYYANLTGNWDLNGDGKPGAGGYFGDHPGGDQGPGGLSFEPDIVVGRIPVYNQYWPDNKVTLDYILQKSIDYEHDTGTWARHALLAVGNTYWHDFVESIKSEVLEPEDFTYYRIYDGGDTLNPPSDVYPSSSQAIVNYWSSHPVGLSFWDTHGGGNVAMDILQSSDCSNLNDSYPSIVFSGACNNAYPDFADNLSYALLRKGAVAAMGAVRPTASGGNMRPLSEYLIKDGMPVGDAFCKCQISDYVLYGDPSLKPSVGPTILHTPLPNTEVTTGHYTVQADLVPDNCLHPIAGGTVYWTTDGGQNFSSAAMSIVSGNTCTAQIPAQNVGTTVGYYVEAEDSESRTRLSPGQAPQVLHTFHVLSDSTAPSITITHAGNIASLAGPYPVTATITDSQLQVASATLYYSKNGGSYASVAMQHQSGSTWVGNIPGPTVPCDRFNYYIQATDSAVNQNTARSPQQGSDGFTIVNRTCVGLWQHKHDFTEPIRDESFHRATPKGLASLTADQLAGIDVLLLDSDIPVADRQAVMDWFVPGKRILTINAGNQFAVAEGLLGPSAQIDFNSTAYPSYSIASHPLTWDLGCCCIVGGVGQAEFLADTLAQDTVVLARDTTNPNIA